MAYVYLALGSNLGDREQNIRQALRLLSLKMKIKKISYLYETEPEGDKAQPYFLNAVCLGETSLSPQELLALAKEIESKLGRKPNSSGAPRPIDIDILFYNCLVLKTDQLTIPHPKLTHRAFVLIPLLEVAPSLIHPESGQKVAQLVWKVSREGIKKFKRICLNY